MTRRVTPQRIEDARALAAAREALGDTTLRLAVVTKYLRTYVAGDGRVVHVWTMAGEYRAEVPNALVTDAAIERAAEVIYRTTHRTP